MSPQSYQQTTGQAAPATRNPQGNVSAPTQNNQSQLQGSATQEVLGQQNARISVSGSGSAVSGQTPTTETPTGGVNLLWVVVLLAALVALAHAYSLKKRRQRRAQEEAIRQQPEIVAPKKKPKTTAKKKKKKAHHR